MIVIVDSNKIMSAIYTPEGVEASMFLAKSKIQFIAPDYVLEEIDEHLDDIADAVAISKRKIQKLVSDIFFGIKIFETAQIPKEHVIKAISLVKDIDYKDFPFVALHLHIKHKLWTGDTALVKGLKQKGFDICITTAELKKSLYKK
jgi:predicted nucleic acid-binding protein